MKINLILLSLFLMFAACSTTKQVRTSQRGLKGSWTLSSVSTDRGNTVSIKTLFNQASPSCFENSSWNFVSNNNSGTYRFNNGSCDDSTHSIKWFMKDNGDEISFLWKFIPEGMKAKDVKAGYELKLISESESEFFLAQNAILEGSTITIYYQFVKNQE
ncbi:Lipocalin-like domain-containing protein [Mariniphaga anaerophila]|uniref:Lipocalin-like domain-containing protein n=1 Tax=Mariniphaga anaerophila TaxID=1484053 RepID=A0A1M4VUE0_9BACT|nr:lipocalin family protein [Mariniphaga anaerophila]SHE72644.1 Lipocalin-like domain-containing protein [Mariniphaga anaerophila]